MSIDPAAAKVGLPSDVLSLEDLGDFQSGVYVFDFDGVVIGADEDDLYHLPEGEGEAALLERAAASFGLFIKPMELRYQRHLLYQAAALTLGVEMEKGPAFETYRKASAAGRAFVLTARSGFYAAERVMRFFRQHEALPVEQFHVGRVGKDGQLQLLCREFAAQKVYFIEDNAAHLARAAKLGLENLRLVHVPRGQPPRGAEDLRRQLMDVLSSFH